MNLREKIKLDAEALGIKKGDTLLVHTAFKKLGENVSPDDVIFGLLGALGEEGTLVLPALSYQNCNANKPYFDYYETKSNIGFLPEYFRTSVKGVKRSICPTHSCCALGKNADFVVGGQKDDNTPCGENSPFRRVKDLGGKILFLGCGMRPNTSMHAVEELSVPDYLFGADVEYTVKDENGKEYKTFCRAHNFKGVAQRYERLANLLEGDELRVGKILQADCHLVECKPMWEKANAKYIECPHYFIDEVNE